MSNHPEELLADYVEGSLGADERAHVEEHLATCDRCREEVELATDARGALLSLPELDAPPGIPLRVRRGARESRPSRTWRFAGAAAAAAVLIVGAVVVIGNLDPEQSTTQSAEEQGESGGGQAPEPAAAGKAGAESGAATDEAFTDARAAAPALPTYLESKRDYEPDGLAPLARRLRDDALDALDLGIEPTARQFFDRFDPAAFTAPVRQAIRCVLAEVPPEQLIVPFRIEAASFQGTPAYVAAFLQGPTPDDAYDRIVLWVVDRESCALLSLASQLL